MSDRKSNIVSFVHHLKMADEFLADFMRDRPDAIACRKFPDYRRRIEWMVKDFITQPVFHNSPDVIDGLKKEWESDVFAIPEILSKISLLRPEQRDAVEYLVEQLLNGESLQIEHVQK